MKATFKEIVPKITDKILATKDFEALLPKLPMHQAEIVLTNTPVEVANALRRTLVDEIRGVHLYTEISSIVTNEPFIIMSELYKRISLIPIKQDVDRESMFELIAENNTRQPKTIYSKDIQPAAGKTKRTKEPLFDEEFELFVLGPGKAFKCKTIKILEGWGYENIAFSPTFQVAHKHTDYVMISFVNSRGNIERATVKAADLKVTSKKPMGILFNPHGETIVDEKDKPRLQYYDIVKKEPPTIYSSTNAEPMEHEISFKSFSNPKDILTQATTTLKARVAAIRKAFDACKDDPEHKESDQDPIFGSSLRYEEADDIYKFHIIGESHTIGGLITKAIFREDPSIALINYKWEHPRIRNIVININHGEPKKIFDKALKAVTVSLDKLFK